MITRALGDANLKPYCTAEPSYKQVPLDAACEFLVLVCDGVTDVFQDQVSQASQKRKKKKFISKLLLF